MKGTLLSVYAGARRLTEREKAEREVTVLQHSYEHSLKQAKEKQSHMESLLSLWQKYVNFHFEFIYKMYFQIYDTFTILQQNVKQKVHMYKKLWAIIVLFF